MHSVAFLICFLICFVGGFLVSAVRFYRDALAWKRGDPFIRKITMALLLRFCQAGLSIAGIFLVFKEKLDRKWLDIVMLCILQLFVGTSLAQILYATSELRLAPWVAYASTLWFSPDIAFSVRNILRSNFDVLSRASIASFALLLIWYNALQINKNLKSSSNARQINKYWRSSRYRLWLRLLIGINAAAMFCQTSGAILFYVLLLANKNLGTTIRQSIILACIFVQVVQLFIILMKRVIDPYEYSIRPENIDLEGARRLNSRGTDADLQESVPM